MYQLCSALQKTRRDDILEEYRDVLSRKKFHFDPARVEVVLQEIRRIGLYSDAMEVDEEFPDPDDTVFFEVAMSFHENEDNTFLVTGNTKHFPKHPIVVTPADFVKIIEEM